MCKIQNQQDLKKRVQSSPNKSTIKSALDSWQSTNLELEKVEDKVENCKQILEATKKKDEITTAILLDTFRDKERLRQTVFKQIMGNWRKKMTKNVCFL